MTDPVAVFLAALPANAGRRFALDQVTDGLIRACVDAGHNPAVLAAIVGAGIGRVEPLNGAALMRYRLARESEQED